jgi:uncharacterized protein YbcI
MAADRLAFDRDRTAVRKGSGCMKTRGEVEAAICEGVAHFMQEFMGRGPTEIRTHLIGNLLLVRLQGILTPAETSLAAVQPPEKGRDMLKHVRTYMLETSRPRIDAVIQQSTGLRCVSMHHDISTITGEEVFVFTLSGEMNLRDTKRK